MNPVLLLQTRKKKEKTTVVVLLRPTEEEACSCAASLDSAHPNRYPAQIGRHAFRPPRATHFKRRSQ